MATAAVNGGQSLPSKTRRLSISEEKDQDSSPNFEKVPCECSDFPNTRSHNGKKKGSTAGRQRRSVRIPCSEAVSVRCRGLQRCLRSVCPRSSLWLYGDEESERSWEPGLSLLLLLPLYLSHPLPLSLSVCVSGSVIESRPGMWVTLQAGKQAGWALPGTSRHPPPTQPPRRTQTPSYPAPPSMCATLQRRSF